MNPLIGAISKWKYLLLLKLWPPSPFFPAPVQVTENEKVKLMLRYLDDIVTSYLEGRTRGGRQAPHPSLPVLLPLKGAPMSDESTWENYINSLLKFVIWKWVHDRIGYIVKNGINKGDFKGGHTNKNLAPPPHTNALAGPCVAPLVLNLRTSMPKANLSGSY